MSYPEITLINQANCPDFQNVRAYISSSSNQLKVEFRAEAYTEPHSKYLILLNNEEEEVEFLHWETSFL